MKNNVIQFPKEKEQKDSPYPGSVTFWIPEKEELRSMIVQCREGMPEIRNEQTLLHLMAEKVAWRLEYAEDYPKEAAQYMEDELYRKGLLETEPNWTKIAAGDVLEIYALINTFSIKEKIMLMSGIKKSSFPLKPVRKKELLEVIQEESIVNWIDTITWTVWNG